MYEKKFYLSVLSLCKKNGNVSVAEIEANLLCSRTMAKDIVNHLFWMNLIEGGPQFYKLKGIHSSQTEEELAEVFSKKAKKGWPSVK